jgi:hypothetical protein
LEVKPVRVGVPKQRPGDVLIFFHCCNYITVRGEIGDAIPLSFGNNN